jgi:PadR family transcriptional regulator, regulatory protein PadR
MSTASDAGPLEVLQGSLDVLILKAASWGPRHGYAIAQWIETRSGGALVIKPSTLYPALHRLEGKGWLEGEWALNDRNQQVKHYTLTQKGRQELRAETKAWGRYVAAFERVLGAATS